MGCFHSKPEDGGISREIDSMLMKDKAIQDKEIKMLLLGTGESGKSTIVKQMKVMYQGGYSPEECQSFISVIANNSLQSMKALCNGATTLSLALDSDENRTSAVIVIEAASNGDCSNISPQLGAMLIALWKDHGIQAAFERRNEFQLNDSTKYYMDNMARICQPGYMPTVDDVLRSRVRTTGIVETQFSFQELRFRMFDVGGQRNERKKWIHCFQDVTAVVFVVGISEYDQRLLEDSTQNRMLESLLLFDEICNSRWFSETAMILFLNKIDLFAEKIKKGIPLSLFPDYKDGQNVEAAQEFIKKKFLEKNKSAKTKAVYPHITCATDTENVKRVFNAVKDVLLQGSLKENGFF
jgi:GTPase SAR1 family protein